MSKIINIKVTFEDTFSKCLLTKVCTRSEETFRKMQNGIGQTVRQVENGIAFEWRVIKVEQV